MRRRSERYSVFRKTSLRIPMDESTSEVPAGSVWHRLPPWFNGWNSPPVVRNVPAVRMAKSSSPHASVAGPSPHREATRCAAPKAAAAPEVQHLPTGTETSRFWRTRSARSTPADVNRGLSCPRAPDMLKLFGDPNGGRAKALLSTASVGPFSIYGMTPALDRLRRVFADVRRDLPELYALIGHDGMYNVRYKGGTMTRSNHAWGAAIDLKIGGYLVPRRAQFSVRGLDALVPYFNKAGWYWGGGYRGNFNDPMHSECGHALLQGFTS